MEQSAVGWASGPLGDVQAADREIARQTARRARAVAAFADSRPASADRAPGEPGCMGADRRAARPESLAGVSEWAAQELAVALSITTPAAEALLDRSLTLVHRLPATLAALEAGLLHVGHLWPLLEKLAPVADVVVRERLERDLLAWVAGRQVTTPAQLGAKLRRELLARNVRTAARELEAALRRRGVEVRPDRVDGMAVLSALLTVPEAEALLDALRRCADAVEDDPGVPQRTRQQKMVDCLLDLVLRPGETTLPVVQAQLTVVAGVSTLAGGDEPGEVAGHPVPAEMVRALARALGLLPDDTGTDPGEREPGPDAAGLPAEDPALAAEERWWAEVEARALRGDWDGEDDPPPVAQPPWEDGEAATPVGISRRDVGATRLEDATVATELSWWAAADRAVDQAGAASLGLDRELARARAAVEAAEIADLADLADVEDVERSPASRMSSAPDALGALVHASVFQRAELGRLLERTGGGGLVDRPRIAVTDALTGALVALTDARELRMAAAAGHGLGPPGECRTYRPGAALDRFVRARDRRCRFPGCRRRVPGGGELDHHERWPDGPTAAANLTGFCISHHRGKHQAPGWRFDLSPDGVLTVTTPSGLTAGAGPPPF